MNQTIDTSIIYEIIAEQQIQLHITKKALTDLQEKTTALEVQIQKDARV